MVSQLQGFTHLEVHSHYSLLQGTMPVQELVDRALADNLKALALTDTNALYGAVSFSRACRAAGIKPILGMAAQVAAPAGVMPPDAEVPGKLLFLANGAGGYRSLCALASYLQGGGGSRVQNPILPWEIVRQHRQGLICLSGGHQGWLARLLGTGRRDAAARFVAQLGGLFHEQYILSICPRYPADPLAEEMATLAQRFGLPLAAVQPIYCRQPEEISRLRLLAAIDGNCRLTEVPESSLPAMGDANVPIHWPTPAAVGERFAAFPEALAMTGKIADLCEPGLPDGRPIWPVLPLANGQTPEEAVANAATTGLSNIYGAQLEGSMRERLGKELAAIANHGFAPLFLIVADIVRFARQENIPVNTRGSVANSLVAYCLGITQVDPIAHDLLFERFLNPARVSLPDIDLDFCSRRRDEVLGYVRRTYGTDRVALVGTMSTLQMRSAVRESAKVYGFKQEELKKLASRIPRRWHPDPRRRQAWDIEQILEGLEPRQQEVVRAAAEISGQPHHLSVHPGGIILTPGPLTDTLPVQMAPKGFLITQFDFRDLENIGLPKIDLLGIRALTVLADTTDLIRKYHDPNFKLEDIPLADEPTADLLSKGDTIGVFQCESSGARRTLRQLKVRHIRDLAVANAFFKPGPATGGMAPAFVRRYRGEEPVSFLHPALKSILGPTMGVLLFQEQVLRIAGEIAGLSWAQAEGLRKGMSKFQAQEMAALASAFIAGCLRPAPEGPAFNQEQARKLWEQVIAFAGYGFNQGHATAYGDVSYRSAYLKTHFPAEFLCARLADRGGFHHPAVYMAEAVRLGISVRPPHINHSGRAFSLSPGPDPIMWMGLGQVRDLRRKSVKAIVDQRSKQRFADLADLVARVDLQRKEIDHLIRCGGLDGLGESRAQMLQEADQMNRAGSSRQMIFAFAKVADAAPESPGERYQWETHILGHPVSVHPLDLVPGLEKHLALRQLSQHQNQAVVVLGTRLPGWTGGKGFYFGDGDSYELVIPDPHLEDRKPQPWQPLRLEGRWRVDEWGGGWLQAASITLLS
jgi:DNA-directed DNA polymerase III PolC